jgi:hypothetical protein
MPEQAEYEVDDGIVVQFALPADVPYAVPAFL